MNRNVGGIEKLPTLMYPKQKRKKTRLMAYFGLPPFTEKQED
jgi:hypothetical protein